MDNESIKNLILVNLFSDDPDYARTRNITKEEQEQMYELWKNKASYKEIFSVIKDEHYRNKMIELFDQL